MSGFHKVLFVIGLLCAGFGAVSGVALMLWVLAVTEK
jgi:hypothetical protein